MIPRLQDACDKIYLAEAHSVGNLTSPAEVGELFKVIALGHSIETTLIGISRCDYMTTLLAIAVGKGVSYNCPLVSASSAEKSSVDKGCEIR